ncbi:MAG: LacI family DNA-binding transcriptional regulator [Lentisphaeria bacterium]|nr:LacI family DNA-binding transcriptional regulator [Lentisphaeria bacterium]
MTQSEIAGKLGISQSSVSLVLRDPATSRVSEKTKARIISSLKASRYMTRSGVTRSWNLGYVTDIFQDLHQDFFQDSLLGIEEEAARNHYNLITECLRGKSLNLLTNNKVDGLIIRSGKAYEILLQNDIAVPVVLLNCATPIRQCDSVMPDNRSGICKVIRFLQGENAKNFVFVSCKPAYSPYSCNYQEREFAFMEACSTLKMHCSVEYVPEPSAPANELAASLRKLVERWKRDKTLILVSVNHYYASLIHELYPEGKIFAGDNKAEKGFESNDFPMLVQDASYMGKTAAELLIKRIAEPSRPFVRINCDMQLFLPGPEKRKKAESQKKIRFQG